MRFRREITALDEIFDFLGAFLSRQKIDDETAFAINLSVEELFTNMVRHSPEGKQDVEIEISLEDKDVVVVLTDHGVDSFDPTRSREVDTSKPIQERQPGGLGVFLTNQIMDDVRYEYFDRCSRITLTKKLRS